ncbi:MAG: DNA topoisomerase VI [Candidatus Hydrothermarchaeaceae archaeon]
MGGKRVGGVPIKEELNAQEFLEEIKDLATTILEDIKSRKNPGFDVPNRGSTNIVYDDKNDMIYLGKKKSRRTFHNVATATAFTQMLFVLSVLQEAAERKKHLTKREVYYQDPELFNKDQSASDNMLEDIAVTMGVTRPCIRVVAAAKGVCIGDLTLRERDDTFNCDSLGRGGWSISPFIDEVDIMDCGAEYVLVVEKDAAMIRLIEEDFHKNNKCLLITGKGQPDIATRRLIRRLNKEWELPVYVLTDSDSYGMQICSSYKRGSISLSFESSYLAVPKAKFLGLLPSDLDKFKVPKAARLEMTDWDMKKAQNMLNYPWIRNNKKWRSELQLMVDRREKAELQALAKHGITFMTDVYIPQKLESRDWI